MKRFVIILLFLVTNLSAQIKFEDFFLDKTLRFDYYHTGDAKSQSIVFGELREEPYWGGPKKNLIDPFNFGNYKYEVYDKETGKLIFSKGYSTLFAEWLTTPEAKKISRAFHETVTFPFPKREVILKLYSRDRKNNFVLNYEIEIDPDNPFIKKDKTNSFSSSKFIDNGDPSQKVDIVIIPEGYTGNELDKFKKDVEKFVKALFGSSPYKENINNFNKISYSNNNTIFKVGESVTHDDFGNGKVIHIEDNKLIIIFKKYGEKKIIDKFIKKSNG